MPAQPVKDGMWKGCQEFHCIAKILAKSLKYAVDDSLKYPLFIFYDLRGKRIALEKK